jgi:hypothetical protein
MVRAARQCRRPSDRAGRTVLQRMNVSHAAVTQWGLSHVAVGEDLTILDVGCGGGRTVDRLASIATRGKVYGVDYSEASVATARETNERAVLKRGGRFLIIAETYRGRRNDWLYRPTMTLLLRAAYLTPAQHRQLLVDADVQVLEEKSQGWICAIGTRA